MGMRIDGPRSTAVPAQVDDAADVETTAAPTSTASAAPTDGFEGVSEPPDSDAADGVGTPLLKRNDNQKVPDAKVKDLQDSLNTWLEAHGKPKLDSDGFYGPKTEKAVRDFQTANKLPVDGQAGVMTQNRMQLENDPNFQKLGDAAKATVRQQMTEASTNQGQIDNVKTVATAPGFNQLSPEMQQKMLGEVKDHRNDADIAKNLAALSNSPTFRDLNDGTKGKVLDQLDRAGSDPAAQANLTTLATAPGFDKLGTGHQEQMLKALEANADDANVTARLAALAGDPKFAAASDPSKTAMIAAAGDPSIPDANLKAAKDLTESKEYAALSDGDKALVQAGLKGAKDDPTYAASVKTLIADPKFGKLSADEKTAVLSQVKNYPDARSVKNIDRMLQKDWFTSQSLADKQRSLKTVGRLSQYDGGDKAVRDNTLDKFLSPTSNYKLVWKDYPATPGSTTYGEGDGDTLWLNKGLISADNDRMVENDATNHLVLATTPHEVNHLLNGDKVKPTFHYFEAEYRAWYVGFKAEHGREPTNAEAMKQRISWQLNPSSFYGKYAGDALKDPKEASQFYDLLSKMSGKKVDASNFKTVIAEDPATWPSATKPAPVPSGNVDNH